MRIPKELEQKLRTFTDLPSLPMVAAEIVELAQMPGVDLRAVASAVTKDPALSAKVLRIANSALYAQRRRSTNMRQALIVLGLNATMTLALSLSLVGDLTTRGSGGLNFMGFWRRSILAATWAKQLATEIGRPDAEEVFLAALMQDIGMLALDRAMPDLYAADDLDQSDHDAVCRHEISELGADHAAVGGWLTEHWNLPSGMVSAIAGSHDAELASVEEKPRSFRACVVTSGLLADAWLRGAEAEEIEDLAAQVKELLGVDEPRLGDLFETISGQLPVTEDVFDMKLFNYEQSAQMFERAREVLIVRNLKFMSEVDQLRQTAEILENQKRQLLENHKRDALTNVFNRAYLEEALITEFETANDNGWPLSIAFVDLDEFKDINDTHGHRAGDIVLREAARVLTDCVRDSDIVARYGGDEFVLLLPGTDHEGARIVCSRIVESMRVCRAEMDDTELCVTSSVGLATFDSSTNFLKAGDLIEAADKALYVAKAQGRDQFASCLENAQQRRAQG